ncbi:flagellar motor stator protein MotA [Hydrogenophilus thermoluteolus]|uniref:Flagellar motor stator protein MotA n=1 Tax=Hydrogenophilus thermoluteolus TaxID=297 RepID=A0A2Z6DZ18_HYDTE|nr:flagellar motor stator protein MotA [Hydrogenophilus thermoluteolus]BBD77796.1 flagellar motor stator protein MotA [Hydrogenophilus thermoluteolus]
MFLLIGYVIILASALGTYAVHGSLAALFVPTEYIAIVGLLIGSFVASNNPSSLKAAVGGLAAVFKNSPYTRAFYIELLALLFEILTKVRKEGLMAIEQDVENPEGSAIFGKYPLVLHDHHLVEFITDYLRMMVSGSLNAIEVEGLMEQEIETHHIEAHLPAHLISKAADSVPAFGIVVAVMGVVNVMGSVGEPPAVLGKMIGGALVGTFLGILVSYGFVGPIASQLELKVQDGSKPFQVAKAVLLASMNGYPPQMAVEFGRKVLWSTVRPTFAELEEELKNRK